MQKIGQRAVITGPGNLFAEFERAARARPDRVAIRAAGGRGRQYTYGEMLAVISGLADVLSESPYAAQNRIGLLAENRAEWPMAYLAILAAGKTVVPIDANLKPKEIAHIVAHAGLRVMFASAAFHALLAERHSDILVLSMDEMFGGISATVPASPVTTEERMEWTEPAVLIYTSGTMGDPKAVMLTHANLLSNLDGVARALHFGEGDIFLSVLPLNHAFEATCGFLSPLTRGSTVAYARSLKSKEILEDIAHNGVTIMCGVPLLFEKMYQAMQRGIASAPMYRRVLFKLLWVLSALGWKLGWKWGKELYRPLRRKAGLSSVRLLVSGGAAVSPAIGRFFNYLGIDFVQGYGLTECAPVISVNRLDDIKFGSIGTALDNLEVKIVDMNEEGEGEIFVRGEAVTPGYWENPNKTAELIRDGWLHTGDLGREHDGHLWITGRAKNVIVSAAGKNIHPEELEERLNEQLLIGESVVFGQRKEGRQGEEVRAIIVPDFEQFRLEFGMEVERPNEVLIASALEKCVADVNDHLAGYKRIVGYTVQMQELDKTSTKKVRRTVYNRREGSPGGMK